MKCCLTMFAFTSACDLHGGPCCYMVSKLQWEKQTISAAYWFYFFIFFFISLEIIWYIGNVCYPTSITVCSTHASSNSHAAARSHRLPPAPTAACKCCPQTTAHGPFFNFAGFWIITELLIYKSQLTGHLFTRTTLRNTWSHQSRICTFVSRLCGPTSSFLLFLSKKYIQKVMLFQTYIA